LINQSNELGTDVVMTNTTVSAPSSKKRALENSVQDQAEPSAATQLILNQMDSYFKNLQSMILTNVETGKTNASNIKKNTALIQENSATILDLEVKMTTEAQSRDSEIFELNKRIEAIEQASRGERTKSDLQEYLDMLARCTLTKANASKVRKILELIIPESIYTELKASDTDDVTLSADISKVNVWMKKRYNKSLVISKISNCFKRGQKIVLTIHFKHLDDVDFALKNRTKAMKLTKISTSNAAIQPTLDVVEQKVFSRLLDRVQEDIIKEISITKRGFINIQHNDYYRVIHDLNEAHFLIENPPTDEFFINLKTKSHFINSAIQMTETPPRFQRKQKEV